METATALNYDRYDNSQIKLSESDGKIIHYADEIEIIRIHIACDKEYSWSSYCSTLKGNAPILYLDKEGRCYTFDKDIVTCHDCKEKFSS